MINTILLIAGILSFFLFLSILLAVFYRRVVKTNEVHIVQSVKKTTSFGKDTGNGNVYYEFPSWIPIIGVTKIILPTSVFDVDLSSYEAYDQERLPFVVDVRAFFRITDSNVSAQRVYSFQELSNQLRFIVQGVIRVVLATNNIDLILQGRSEFGEQFTKEVQAQLTQWGVSTVKNIELMDIRDTKESHVIANIMEKKKSQMEMESRVEVAENKRIAETAEIDAQRDIEVKKQEATQAVGIRKVEAEREVALKSELKEQQILEQQKITKEKEMETIKVKDVKTAEIEKEVSIVQAEKAKEVLLVNSQANKQSKVIDSEAEKQSKVIDSEAEKQSKVIEAEGIKESKVIDAEGIKKSKVIEAEGIKESKVLIADGDLEAKRKESEGIHLEGQARADAEEAMQKASVQSQITLAHEIGTNEKYQQYLITIRELEANEAIGIAQASALTKADVKIINNSGTPQEGLKNIGDLFSSNGGIKIGSMLESLNSMGVGGDLINKFLKPSSKEIVDSSNENKIENSKEVTKK